ncbi:carbohydrate kinase family protein [Paenibacillus piri]|uniref:Carbohydrate kinase n=1 Tax=Paenibacillus piri TaxID=2547395 RepID=A0A4R5KGJ7_9BACL|nr:carbohydrate kinase [Paenibacillus piri]TDF93818.1 carbohydrate kinase [Paenibacillus piri]
MFARASAKIVCLGELFIDLVPEEDASLSPQEVSFQQTAGGSPAQVAAAVAKLGGASRFIGKIGCDAQGSYLRGVLDDAGVDTALAETEAAATAVAAAAPCAAGEPDGMSGFEPRADMLLEAAELEAAWLDDAAVFHFGSASLAAEPCRTATLEAARRVKAAGGIISFAPNLKPALWLDQEAMRREVSAHAALADVLKLAETEAAALTGLEPAEAVQQLLESGAKAVVVTRGEDGCCVVTRKAMTLVPGIRVKAVDKTGAGDSFVGAMLFQLVERGIKADRIEDELTDEETVRHIFSFANKVGAITTTRKGVLQALPDLAEIESV